MFQDGAVTVLGQDPLSSKLYKAEKVMIKSKTEERKVRRHFVFRVKKNLLLWQHYYPRILKIIIMYTSRKIQSKLRETSVIIFKVQDKLASLTAAIEIKKNLNTVFGSFMFEPFNDAEI